MFCKVKNILARRVSDYTGNLEYLVEWQEEKKEKGKRVDCDHTGYNSEPNEEGFFTRREKKAEDDREDTDMTELEMAERALRLCWAPRAALLSICPDAVEAADQKEVNRVDALLRRWRSAYVRGASPPSSTPVIAVGTPSTPNDTRAALQTDSKGSSATPTARLLGETRDDTMREGRRGPAMEREEREAPIHDRTQCRDMERESATLHAGGWEEKKHAIAHTVDLPGEEAHRSGMASCEGRLPTPSDRSSMLPCTPWLDVMDDRSADRRSVSAASAPSSASLPSGAPMAAVGWSSVASGTPQPVERLHGIVWKGKGRRGKGGAPPQKGTAHEDSIPCHDAPLSCTLPRSSSWPPSPASSTSLASHPSTRHTPPLHVVSPSSPSSTLEDRFSVSSTPPTAPTGGSPSPYVILLGDVILSDDATTVLNPEGGPQKKKKKRRKAASPLTRQTSLLSAGRDRRRRVKREGGGEEDEDGDLISRMEEVCTPSQEVEKAWKDMFSNSFLHSCANASRCTPLMHEFACTSGRLIDSSTSSFLNGRADSSHRPPACRRTEGAAEDPHAEYPIDENENGVDGPLFCPAPSLSEVVYTNALHKWVRIIDIVPIACSTHASLHYKDPISIVSLVGMEEAERIKNRVTSAAYHSGTSGGVTMTSHPMSGSGGGGSGGCSGTRSYSTSRNGGAHEGEAVGYGDALFARKEESALVTELLRPQEEQLVVRCLVHRDVGLPIVSPCPPLEEVKKEEGERGFQGGGERMETRKRQRPNGEEELHTVIKKEEVEEEEADMEVKSSSVVKDALGTSWTFVTLPLALCRLSFPQLLIDYLLQHTVVLEAE